MSNIGTAGTPDRTPQVDYRTPLKRVRGMGSAKSGVEHWWRQRITAVVLVILVPWLGMQVVIEDYVHVRWLDVMLQVLVTLACALAGLASLFAIGHIALTVATYSR
jgi:succinate dehydrogenase / fumarate reductase membrane anchor subunit